MNRKHAPKILLTFTLALAMAVPFLTLARAVSAEANNFFGAIFTTLGNGTAVNQNTYASKADVYLNGGPQNANSQGLPNGTYYFQVTDPSGAHLLSTDLASCRQLTVSGNVIAGAAGPCPHANGILNPANGSMPVQLIPFDDTPNAGGEYKVWLIRQTSTTTIAADGIHINFDNKDEKSDNFKVLRPVCTENCNPETTISGRKFYDANANSIDNGEAGVGGVKINVTITTADGTTTTTVITQPDGSWTLEHVPAGATYVVCEELPLTCEADGSYWVETAPVPDSQGSQCYSGTVGNDPINGLDFGDICFHRASGGLTLGFWSNKNGEKILKANDNFASGLAFLRGLCLKNLNGTDFDPTTYAQFRTWLLSGNAVNMAYMLSVQLSATSLDVRYGFLSDTQLVDASSLGLGIVSIGAVRNAANTELCSPGGNLTFTGNPLRQDEEILKDALDGINNNRLPFASSTPCSVCYPVPAP